MAAAICLLLAVRSGWRSFRTIAPEERPGSRVLLALHEAAAAGFWLSLGAFFLGYAIADEPQSLRWFVMVPIATASLRLLTAILLARR